MGTYVEDVENPGRITHYIGKRASEPNNALFLDANMLNFPEVQTLLPEDAYNRCWSYIRNMNDHLKNQPRIHVPYPIWTEVKKGIDNFLRLSQQKINNNSIPNNIKNSLESLNKQVTSLDDILAKTYKQDPIRDDVYNLFYKAVLNINHLYGLKKDGSISTSDEKLVAWTIAHAYSTGENTHIFTTDSDVTNLLKYTYKILVAKNIGNKNEKDSGKRLLNSRIVLHTYSKEQQVFTIDFDSGYTDEEFIWKSSNYEMITSLLQSIPQIMGDLDVLLQKDIALQKAVENKKSEELRKLAEREQLVSVRQGLHTIFTIFYQKDAENIKNVPEAEKAHSTLEEIANLAEIIGYTGLKSAIDKYIPEIAARKKKLENLEEVMRTQREISATLGLYNPKNIEELSALTKKLSESLNPKQQ